MKSSYQELLIPAVYLFRAIIQTHIDLISRSIEHHRVTLFLFLICNTHTFSLSLSLNYQSPIGPFRIDLERKEKNFFSLGRSRKKSRALRRVGKRVPRRETWETGEGEKYFPQGARARARVCVCVCVCVCARSFAIATAIKGFVLMSRFRNFHLYTCYQWTDNPSRRQTRCSNVNVSVKGANRFLNNT